MREFFRNCLKNLYVYCGNRQIDKMDNEEIRILLDALERMSKLYNYIPEERQKEIIQNCLLTDKEYQNINVRTVAKWLELNGKHYFKEEAHQPNPEPGEYVTGERREKYIQDFLQAIASTTQTFTSAMEGDQYKGSGARMRDNFKPMERKPFIVEGLEIYAYTEEEALMIYKQSVSESGESPK